MFELAVGTTPCDLKANDFRQLGMLSEGYSGSDISIAVQDALMQPVRKIQTATHYKSVMVEVSDEMEDAAEEDMKNGEVDGSGNKENGNAKKKQGKTKMVEKLTPCSPGDKGAREMNWTEVDSEMLLEPPLVLKDFVKAVKGARPTVSAEDIKKSAEWTAEFGSEGG